MKRSQREVPTSGERFRFDFTFVLIVVVAIAVILVLTFELWISPGHVH